MSSVLFEVADGVATLTLNRPEVLNAFNRDMTHRLREYVDQVAADSSLRAILLTGSGRAFSSGQDLAEALPSGAEKPDLGNILRDTYNPVVRALRTIEKPVVCAVNGVAAGA